MPFCPACRYEYNPGIERCPDCDAELVAELPADDAGDETIELASYPSEVDAQLAKLRLEAEGIASAVVGQVVTRARTRAAWVGGGAKLLVQKCDTARARRILEEK